ncbi:GDSL lipase/esterase [Arabidopsis thaliana x Arabidopsis arenosa]|jgi:phospholipase/lecithinase/hemolysin|uniref:GDSL-motif lipase 7 n=2 Tax=Arabidopsis TaxID=3701 RepID=A0A1P8BHE5_ARATH|nr:GDSL-motif lipase 7 [Arabidopsis thaliana]ANM71022.1 GDSL-motif lipase 7 [Arabidopsis thaliana]KAG7602375.1 GDSL lipase/esterase [Arabidopsis thaliana x Arabidopsis arenosa]|eukprot:NP_001332582.1 GDSL-motif lipase 7 [Arabidopsis thaliana]
MKSLLICLVLLELVWLGNGQSRDHQPLAPAFFVFGDSLVDSGNNNYIPTLARANYFPYGIDFGFPTGRFCNGRTVVDYGATYLGLPLVPPYLSPLSIGQNALRGVNYASAAAGILDETGRHYGARTTFNGQISQFEITIELRLRRFFQNPADLRKYLAKSIIGINIGSNDYINNYLMPERYSTSQTYSGEDYADLLIKTLSAQISRLYNLGARKMVLAGSGPLGCIPSQLSMVTGNNTSGCVTKINNMVSMFNSRLKDLANTLNTTLPGSFFVYQNVFDLFHDMVVNPSRYGKMTSIPIYKGLLLFLYISTEF